VKESWKEVLENGEKLQEKELLDLYRIVMNNNSSKDDPKIIKRRRKIIKKLHKSKYRRWSMKLLTNEVGRGPKRLLKFVITKDREKTINQ